MHILFLTHYFPPEGNAPANRTWEHATQWVKREGTRVTVITNHPNHPNGVLFPGYKNQWLTKESKNGVDIWRVRTFLAPNKGFLGRTINYLFFMVAAFAATIWVKTPDVVVATSPQFFCAVAGYLAGAFRRIPFVFELRDLWPESIVTVGAMKFGLLTRLLEKVELFLYRSAARVVVVTDSFKENLVSRGVPPRKIVVVKNGVDLGVFDPSAPIAPDIRAHRTAGKFIVSYIGTVGLAHGLETIVEVAARLRGNPKFLFLIVGDGAEKDNVAASIARLKLDNVLLVHGVSRERVMGYYAASDLCLVTLRNKPLFRTVLPSKIFEIMGMSRPILCTVDGECRRVIEEAGSGVFASPENVEEITRAIELMSNQPELLRAMGQRGRRFVERQFDRKDLAERFLRVLLGLAATLPPALEGEPEHIEELIDTQP